MDLIRPGRLLAVLLASSVLAGCATVRNAVSPPRFTPAQAALLARALPAADSIVADPVFRAVARQMEEEEQIHWSREKLALIPDGARGRPTAWLLARFETEGGYRLEDLSPDRFSGTSVTAVTRPCAPHDAGCRPRTRVNPEAVQVDSARTIYALSNTLVHERVHAFGQKHGESQARAPNVCDAAYVLGDMAETLLRYRAEGGPVTPRQTLCLALQHRLRRRGIVR